MNETTKRHVSYSQYRTWSTCPHQFKLAYIDGLKPDDNNINLVFGTAIHETIQEWLNIHYTNPAQAKIIDTTITFKEKFMNLFKESIVIQEDGTKKFLTDKKEFTEFYLDGCEILSHIQKHAKDFFPTKSFKLIGCEVALQIPLREELEFVGYLDIVIQDTKNDLYYILDLKTSTRGWTYQKKDPGKVNQVLLYKKYFSQHFNVDMDKIIPKFIILKRKIPNNTPFPVSRLVEFEPAHGKVSMNKVDASWNQFLNECFDVNGKHVQTVLQATPSQINCRYCPFKNSPSLCSSSFYK